MKRNTLNATIGVALSAVRTASAAAQAPIDRTTLPIPEPKNPRVEKGGASPSRKSPWCG